MLAAIISSVHLTWSVSHDRDKKLYKHAYQLKEICRFYNCNLVPTAIKSAGDGPTKTAYYINITGSKNVASSRRYIRRMYETKQHGTLRLCFHEQQAGAEQQQAAEDIQTEEVSVPCCFEQICISATALNRLCNRRYLFYISM